MSRLPKLFAVVLMVWLMAASCKKDHVPPALRTTEFDSLVETEPLVQLPVTETINSLIGGYYRALPAHYSQTSKNYPLLIFIPGGGQFGNGASDLPFVLNDGIAQLLTEKKLPGNFFVNGHNFSFIILSPQFAGYPANSTIASFINYAKKKYRVDASRIYLSGLSMGGIVTTEFAAAYPSMLAAIVPMSGVLTPVATDQKCQAIAKANLPVWAFHNAGDPSINASLPQRFISLVNSFAPAVPARLTLFQASIHDAWTAAINPDYKEDNMNIYEWMLQYSR